MNILLNMKKFFYNLSFIIKQKRLMFIVLCISTIIALIIGIYAGLNLNNQVFSIDLSTIAYIQFLKQECGLLSLVLKQFFSLLIFYLLIFLCNSKWFLKPIAIIIYMYLVYTQTVVLISLIVIYGFLNSLVLFFVVLSYEVVLLIIFVVAIIQMSVIPTDNCYLKNGCCRDGYVVWFLLALLIVCIVFSVILAILRTFVILLVF